MDGIARIVHGDGYVMLSAQSAYDVELLLEHVQWYAKRQGQILLDVGRNAWVVSAFNGDEGEHCARCSRRLTDLAFTGGSMGSLCTRCTNDELQTRVQPWYRRMYARRSTKPLGVANGAAAA